jgi:hypothetical protein
MTIKIRRRHVDQSASLSISSSYAPGASSKLIGESSIRNLKGESVYLQCCSQLRAEKIEVKLSLRSTYEILELVNGKLTVGGIATHLCLPMLPVAGTLGKGAGIRREVGLNKDTVTHLSSLGQRWIEFA